MDLEIPKTVIESSRVDKKSVGSKGSVISSVKNTSEKLAVYSKKATFVEETTHRTHRSEQELQYCKKEY